MWRGAVMFVCGGVVEGVICVCVEGWGGEGNVCIICVGKEELEWWCSVCVGGGGRLEWGGV